MAGVRERPRRFRIIRASSLPNGLAWTGPLVLSRRRLRSQGRQRTTGDGFGAAGCEAVGEPPLRLLEEGPMKSVGPAARTKPGLTLRPSRASCAHGAGFDTREEVWP
jgi:hypothetical protein